MQSEDLLFSDFDFSSSGAQLKSNQVLVEFYWRQILQQAETLETGEPVYKNQIYVKKSYLGQGRYQRFDGPATERDKAMHPQEFAAFKTNSGNTLQGTVLSSWPFIPDELKDLLKNNLIQTVEQLSEVEDQSLGLINPELPRYKALARNWLEKNNSDVIKMREEIDLLKSQLSSMSGNSDNPDVMKTASSKRGRPKKVLEDESTGHSQSGSFGMQD